MSSIGEIQHKVIVVPSSVRSAVARQQDYRLPLQSRANVSAPARNNAAPGTAKLRGEFASLIPKIHRLQGTTSLAVPESYTPPGQLAIRRVIVQKKTEVDAAAQLGPWKANLPQNRAPRHLMERRIREDTSNDSAPDGVADHLADLSHKSRNTTLACKILKACGYRVDRIEEVGALFG
jgi:hypothetical protein